jgi:carotenoid 1,2-hydratase
MESIIRAAGLPDADAGPLRGRWQHAPGAGGADGGPVGADGGGQPAGGPGFAQAVAAGGYAWWYVDALSDDGSTGITLIAFVGSVFSPYYALARRRGAADPENHCALNIAIYGRAAKTWTMTERGRAQLSRTNSTLAIGPSALAWDGTALTIRVDEVAVPIPRRVRGTIRVLPRFCLDTAFPLDARGRHHWRPIAPCARVEVDLTSPAIAWSGEGYFDSNTGVEPLEDAFSTWTWSRTRWRDGTAILYDVAERSGATRDLSLEVDAGGGIVHVPPPPAARLPGTRWGMPRSTRSASPDPPRIIKTLEDSPFYARSSVAAHWRSEPAVAMHEALSLDRFRAPWVQAMLPFRMPRRGG